MALDGRAAASAQYVHARESGSLIPVERALPVQLTDSRRKFINDAAIVPAM